MYRAKSKIERHRRTTHQTEMLMKETCDENASLKMDKKGTGIDQRKTMKRRKTAN